MEDLCRYFKVGRQAYYQDKYRREKRRKYHELVIEHIKELRKIQPRAGIKKLQVDINELLKQAGHAEVGRDRLFQIACEAGLLLKRRKSRQPITTYSRHKYAVQPNRIKEKVATAPGQIAVADITYLTLSGGKHAYLFAITDIYSRYLMGYHLSMSLSHEGAIKALEMARKRIPLGAKLIHHTDRGVQYCCHEFLDKLASLDFLSSMTDADHCAQNAIAERMNGILKSEFFLDLTFNNFAEAQRAVDDAIYTYNNVRRHWSLKLHKPATVHFQTHSLAA